MKQYIINATVDQQRNLSIQQDSAINQGENLSTLLNVQIPTEFAQYVVQIEFECPDGCSYSTPKLSPVQQEESVYVTYLLENCITQSAGNINVQMLFRSKENDAIMFKSTLSSSSVIEVLPSVSAKSQTFARQDFFAKAYQSLQELQADKEHIDSLQADIQSVKEACDTFLAEYQHKLDSGELRGQAGATVVSIVETGKDLDGNSIYTITMSDGGQFNFTVPAGKQGEKGDKGDTGLTGEYITTVFLKQTLPNGDKQYIIGTNMGNEFEFVCPKGDNGINGETITALNHTATDGLGNRTYTFVTNMGKEFSFVSIKGDKGDKGEQGIQGEKGDKGDKGDTPILEGTHEQLTAGKAIADEKGNNIVDTYATKQYHFVENILTNGKFTVNQRGKSVYQGAQQYTVDRWRIDDSSPYITVQVDANGILIKNSSNQTQYLGQYVPKEEIQSNCSYTVTVSKDSNIVSQTFQTPSTSPTQDICIVDNADIMKVSYVASKSAWNFALAIKPLATVHYEWATLLEGNQPTQQYNVNYAVELLRCQMYYQRIVAKVAAQFIGFCEIEHNKSGNMVLQGCLYLPTNMRISNPTLTMYAKSGKFLSVYPNDIFLFITIQNNPSLTGNVLFWRGNCDQEVNVANRMKGSLGLQDVGDYIEIDAEL